MAAQWQAAACIRVQRWWRLQRGGYLGACVCKIGLEIARACARISGDNMGTLTTVAAWAASAEEGSTRSAQLRVWHTWPKRGHPLARLSGEEAQIEKAEVVVGYRRVGVWEALIRATAEVRARGGREGARARNAGRREAEETRRQARDLGRYLQGLACSGGELEGPTGLQAWLYEFDEPLAGRRARWQRTLGLRRWGKGELADSAGQWRVEQVLDTERRPAAGTGGRGKRWVHVRWQGCDEATGEPWGCEWVWGGLLNPSAAEEARGMERRRDAAKRKLSEDEARQRAATRQSEFDRARVAERASRRRQPGERRTAKHGSRGGSGGFDRRRRRPCRRRQATTGRGEGGGENRPRYSRYTGAGHPKR